VEFPPIVQPDLKAHREAVARRLAPTGPAGSLGRLEELGVWLAACQGVCPPRPPDRPRVVLFAGDHGIAARVSTNPLEVTAELVTTVLTGGAAVNVLATAVGATVRVVDMAVDADTPAAVGEHKVRRSSEPIDVADALSAQEATAAVQAGRAVADDEVDGGADLLVAGDLGAGASTPAAVLVAALTGAEPVAVNGFDGGMDGGRDGGINSGVDDGIDDGVDGGIDDAAWMRRTVAIRDALRRARPVITDPIALLRTAGGADLAAMAGFLAQAAARRTPVLLDGLVVGAAAMVAEELAPGARDWWLAGHRSAEPAHDLVLGHLQLTPLLDLGMRRGQATGALAALPLVHLAARLAARS